ncbi:hypothetical protein BT67DRAFT_355942, partial [Trichocladium antarcticum]
GHLARVKTPTKHWTAYQLIYVFIINGIGSMVLAGGINFAIGYLLYATPRPPPGPPPLSPPPFLFTPPVSLVVDAAFTTVLQSILTWCAMVLTVNLDLSRGRVAPLGFVGPASSRAARWFLFVDHYTRARGSALCCGCGARGAARSAAFVAANLGRALLVAVAAFAVLIVPAVGCLMAAGTRYGNDWVFLGRWDAPLFKMVWGGVLGLLLSPTIAFCWMARAGWIV